MAIDLNLLRILKHKDEFYKVRGRVPDAALESTTRTVLADFQKYFQKFPEADVIDIPTFTTLFRTWHTTLKKESMAVYETIFKKMKQDVPEGQKSVILEGMMQVRLSTEMTQLLLKFEEGEIADLGSEMSRMFDQHKKDAKITGIDFIRTEIGELLKMDEHQEGLRWRMNCLADYMRPLRAGDFGIIAGRPNKGKTTFCSSEVSYLAPQIPDNRPVVWLNNEGPGGRIKQRFYQAALGYRLSQMVQENLAGRLVPAYNNLMGMEDRIRVFDIHGMDTVSVEHIIDNQNPGLVIYDMIDNVRGFGSAARTDLALEAMYGWARELCVKYDTVGLATSQISVDGADMLFPQQHMLKDSKTGKQGACDFQIMIGASDQAGMQSIRGIGIVKNKLHVEGKSEDPQARVVFKPEIARFEDVPLAEGDGEDATD